MGRSGHGPIGYRRQSSKASRSAEELYGLIMHIDRTYSAYPKGGEWCFEWQVKRVAVPFSIAVALHRTDRLGPNQMPKGRETSSSTRRHQRPLPGVKGEERRARMQEEPSATRKRRYVTSQSTGNGCCRTAVRRRVPCLVHILGPFVFASPSFSSSFSTSVTSWRRLTQTLIQLPPDWLTHKIGTPVWLARARVKVLDG